MGKAWGGVLCYVVVFGWLSGCGGGDHDSQPAVSRTFSGTVRDARGQALGGVSVLLENRLTDAGALATTAGDGSFSAPVPAGVYDIRLVDESSTSVAAGEFGPVEISADLQRDFTLQDADPTDPGRVSGQLFAQPDTPLANRKLRLVPTTALSYDPNTLATVPDPIEMTTDAEGRFATSFGSDQELGFDLEIYQADGALNEFVDIIKPAGEMTVELASEYLDTVNVHRVSDAADTPRRAAVDSVAAANGAPAAASFDDSRFKRFDLRVIKDNGLGAVASVENGTLPADDRTYFWTTLLGRSRIEGHESLEVLFFDRVKIDGSEERPRLKHMVASGVRFDLIYRYRVQILSKGIVTYRFIDDTGDSYALRVYVDGWHHVSFNSDRPDIRTIQISEGF
jgi:hypothetical protein